jgi:hypothetical protein
MNYPTDFLTNLLMQTSIQCVATAITFTVFPIASVSMLNLVLACAIAQPINLLTKMLFEKVLNASDTAFDSIPTAAIMGPLLAANIAPISIFDLVLRITIVQPIWYLTFLLLDKAFGFEADEKKFQQAMKP